MWLVVAGDLLLARRTSFEGRRFSAAGRTGQRRVALAILAEVELWDNAFTPETPVDGWSTVADVAGRGC